jgi:AraC family transcriptional regulator of adaptative response/methylated-DNA-[protein]-cysteine methyltransferase
MEDALRVRFPEADVIDSPGGLSDVLERVNRAIEEPGFDPGVPLDLRGTAYEVEVWSMLRAIPVGETTNYGALAAKLGTRDARDVTEAIACNPIAVLVPCHRVIKKDGSISGYRWASSASESCWHANNVLGQQTPSRMRAPNSVRR